MRIVVDAMGSDTNPVADVGGAVLAARQWGDEIILVGEYCQGGGRTGASFDEWPEFAGNACRARY